MFRTTSQKGFTLIELLVVISIVSLLSSIVLSSLVSAREKAQAAQIIQTMNSLKVAVELYYQDNSAFPTSLVDGSVDDYMSGDWTDVLTEITDIVTPSASVSCGEGITSGGYLIYYFAPATINFGNVNYYNSTLGTYSGPSEVEHNSRSDNSSLNLPCVSQL